MTGVAWRSRGIPHHVLHAASSQWDKTVLLIRFTKLLCTGLAMVSPCSALLLVDCYYSIGSKIWAKIQLESPDFFFVGMWVWKAPFLTAELCGIQTLHRRGKAQTG